MGLLMVKVKCARWPCLLCRGAQAEWDVQELREALPLPQPQPRGFPARQTEAHGPLQGALSRETPVQLRRAHGELTSPREEEVEGEEEEEGILTDFTVQSRSVRKFLMPASFIRSGAVCSSRRDVPLRLGIGAALPQGSGADGGSVSDHHGAEGHWEHRQLWVSMRNHTRLASVQKHFPLPLCVIHPFIFYVRLSTMLSRKNNIVPSQGYDTLGG